MKKKQGECSYCGQDSSLTEDHVIPKCLFAKGTLANPIKVYACNECNNEKKSQDDSYLRDLLVGDEDSYSNETAKNLFDTKFLSSVRQNKSEFSRTCYSKMSKTSLHSPSGIYLGETYTFNIDYGRLEEIFRKIIIGLHFWLFKQRLTKEADFSINKESSLQELIELKQNLTSKDFFTVNLGEPFRFYMFRDVENGFYYTFWWLIFYENIIYSIVTKNEINLEN